MRTEPLHVVLVSEHASPLASLGSVDAGGQNVYVARVAKELGRLGHRVDVYTRADAPGLPATVCMHAGVHVHHLPAGPREFVPKERLLPHMPEFTARLQARLRTSGVPDILHANFFMSGLAGLRVQNRSGVPLVMTFHALGLVRREHQASADAFPPARTNIERALVRRADRVIAECPQDAADLSRLYGALPARVAMVPCGVDVNDFFPVPRARAREQLGLRDDEFVVLQLGRLVPRKGIDNVIRSMALPPRNLRARLIVVGGDSPVPDEALTPEIGRLRQIAREFAVEDRVRFLGHRQDADLRTCYGAADVFVTTPWYEPFGITPLEAMACGVPVIGSGVGGIQHSVEDGVTGYLVPPKDPAALADKLLTLHCNPALAAAFGRAGIRRVRSLFTWHRVAAGLEDVYRSLVRSEVAVPAHSAFRHVSPVRTRAHLAANA